MPAPPRKPRVDRLPKARGRTRAPGALNKTEARYLEHLERRRLAGEVIYYRFEPLRLVLARSTAYTPDFPVLLPDRTIELHEVKAAWRKKDGSVTPGFRDDARVKIKVAARLFPYFTFRVAYPDRGTWHIEEVSP